MYFTFFIKDLHVQWLKRRDLIFRGVALYHTTQKCSETPNFWVNIMGISSQTENSEYLLNDARPETRSQGIERGTKPSFRQKVPSKKPLKVQKFLTTDQLKTCDAKQLSHYILQSNVLLKINMWYHTWNQNISRKPANIYGHNKNALPFIKCVKE